jgi:hypothetical protein
MNQRTVNCNTSGELTILPCDIREGIKIVLVDNKQAPVAWYEFNSRQLKNIGVIKYKANSVRIMFEGIKPSMISELAAE